LDSCIARLQFLLAGLQDLENALGDEKEDRPEFTAEEFVVAFADRMATLHPRFRFVHCREPQHRLDLHCHVLQGKSDVGKDMWNAIRYAANTIAFNDTVRLACEKVVKKKLGAVLWQRANATRFASVLAASLALSHNFGEKSLLDWVLHVLRGLPSLTATSVSRKMIAEHLSTREAKIQVWNFGTLAGSVLLPLHFSLWAWAKKDGKHAWTTSDIRGYFTDVAWLLLEHAADAEVCARMARREQTLLSLKYPLYCEDKRTGKGSKLAWRTPEFQWIPLNKSMEEVLAIAPPKLRQLGAAKYIGDSGVRDPHIKSLPLGEEFDMCKCLVALAAKTILEVNKYCLHKSDVLLPTQPSPTISEGMVGSMKEVIHGMGHSAIRDQMLRAYVVSQRGSSCQPVLDMASEMWSLCVGAATKFVEPVSVRRQRHSQENPTPSKRDVYSGFNLCIDAVRLKKFVCPALHQQRKARSLFGFKGFSQARDCAVLAKALINFDKKNATKYPKVKIGAPCDFDHCVSLKLWKEAQTTASCTESSEPSSDDSSDSESDSDSRSESDSDSSSHTDSNSSDAQSDLESSRAAKTRCVQKR